MGVPTSEVGYTAAMPRREDNEVHKDMWWHWTKEQYFLYLIVSKKNFCWLCIEASKHVAVSYIELSIKYIVHIFAGYSL